MQTREYALWYGMLDSVLDWLTRLLKVGRLSDLEMLKLGTEISDAPAAWGEPFDEEADEEEGEAMPGVRVYLFDAKTHEVRVTTWHGRIHAIVYFSRFSYPKEDLLHVLKYYGSKEGWRTLTEGYLYRTSDDTISLWCSALPAIGVGTTEFMTERGKYGAEDSER